jgi:predicted transcriptional regulator
VIRKVVLIDLNFDQALDVVQHDKHSADIADPSRVRIGVVDLLKRHSNIGRCARRLALPKQV